MSENYIVINGKRAELTKEQMEQLGIKVEENKRWRANDQDRYWFVEDSGYLRSTLEANCYCDDFRYYSHNYFRTEEEGRIYARVLETEMLLKKYADDHNGKFEDCKYELYINEIDSVLIGIVLVSYIYTRTIWFSSEYVALEAIKEIGKDRIIEYLTYEW